ncbi:DUF3108 domain-containing protein [Thiohalobacter thiocyanaticus]|uniref:DUF3108 domain-containing protein n=1 Tax=Thiohalobacter thiocyanaticus TaxID=585455 RepID=A0A426QGJ6_9GAMM|nr:DUF3108 domain-containing protein [Thiohalobacter thiocyanaticus]RRQ20875.1 DUF3108 domain-containing protein [Thiohalobacter thiocyanaticus]
MKPALLCLLLCCLGTMTVRAEARGWDGDYERLHFSIHWLFVPAGMAILEARSPAPGRARFRLEACSNAAVDLVYEVRDLIRAEARRTDRGLRPLGYRFRQQEGRHRNDLTLDFPWPGTVRMTDHLEQKTITYPVAPDTLDMVSAFFTTRSLPLEAGETYRLPVVDKDRHYILSVEVLGRERLDTLLGEDTPTVKIHPRLQSDGIFKRSGEMHLWLTDDDRHLPVRMESRVKYGKVISELTGIYRQALEIPREGLMCELLRGENR